MLDACPSFCMKITKGPTSNPPQLLHPRKPTAKHTQNDVPWKAGGQPGLKIWAIFWVSMLGFWGVTHLGWKHGYPRLIFAHQKRITTGLNLQGFTGCCITPEDLTSIQLLVTLWKINIATENGPLKMYFLLKLGIFQPAMLV